MSDRILAAVMPAPRQPIEIREFARPDLPPGRAAAHRALGGLRHRRAPLARPAGRRAVSDHSRTRLRRRRSSDSRAAARASTAPMLREGDRVVFFDVHRTCGRCRACTVHRTPTRCSARRVYGITDSAAEGLFGGWSQAIYLEPGVGDRAAARRGQLRRLHRRRLRPADGRAHHRARRASARRHRARPGHGRRRAERHRAGPARRRVDDLRHRRARGAARARARRWARTACWIWTRSTPSERLEHGPRADPRRRRRRRRSKRPAPRAAFEEGLTLVRDGGRYVVAGHYTDVGVEPVNAHQHINRKHLEIRGCWGSEPRHFLRALTFPRALRRRGAVARDRRAHLCAASAQRGAGRRRGDADHQGAGGSRGHRRSESANMRHTKIIATVGPASTVAGDARGLLVAGVDVFRLNFSHGTHESPCRGRTSAIRDGVRRAGRHVAIMQDLSGPKIRTGRSPAASRCSCAKERAAPRGRRRRRRARPDLHAVCRAGSLGPARATACCSTTARSSCAWSAPSADELDTVVVKGGCSASTRASTRPACAARVGCHGEGRGRSALRPRARRGLGGAELRADGRRSCVRARQIMATPDARRRSSRRSSGRRRSRISTRFSQVAQGVMVARGDLGLEMPLEQVPRVQKQIIRTRPGARASGDRGDAGARVDAHRAAADARGGQRRGERGGRGGRRDHAGRRDGGRRVSGAGGRRRSRRSSTTPS